MTLPSVLEGFALSQYNAMVGMTPSTAGGITYWTEAVRYLLTKHKQTENITKAVRNLQDTNQKPERDVKRLLAG